MPTLRYLHYDVFTSRPFEGNQLAVFVDARGLSGAEMQRLDQRDELRREHVRAAGRDRRTPTSACASSRRRARCRWPGIPPSAPPSRWPTQGVIAARARAVGVRPEHRPDAGGARLGGRRARHGVDGSGPAGVPAAGHAGRGACCGAIGADRAAWTGDRVADVEEGSCGAPSSTCRWRRARRWTPASPTSRRCGGCAAPSPAGTSACSSSAREDAGDGPPSTAGCSRRRPACVEDPATGSASGPLGGYLVRHGVVPLADGAAHRQRAGREDGPAEPPARPGRGDAHRPTSPACTSAARAVRVGEGTISW